MWAAPCLLISCTSVKSWLGTMSELFFYCAYLLVLGTWGTFPPRTRPRQNRTCLTRWRHVHNAQISLFFLSSSATFISRILCALCAQEESTSHNYDIISCPLFSTSSLATLYSQYADVVATGGLQMEGKIAVIEAPLHFTDLNTGSNTDGLFCIHHHHMRYDSGLSFPHTRVQMDMPRIT
jgi:hypothetical protein